VKGVLAILSAQGIGRFIEMPDLFRFYRIFKKGVLDRGVGYEVEEDNAREGNSGNSGDITLISIDILIIS
jgi:hypothetical protein